MQCREQIDNNRQKVMLRKKGENAIVVDKDDADESEAADKADPPQQTWLPNRFGSIFPSFVPTSQEMSQRVHIQRASCAYTENYRIYSTVYSIQYIKSILYPLYISVVS